MEAPLSYSINRDTNEFDSLNNNNNNVKSAYSIDERKEILQNQRVQQSVTSEYESIIAFSRAFLVEKNSAKWFFSENQIEYHREQWKNQDWYKINNQTKDEETLERQLAALLIGFIGEDLYVPQKIIDNCIMLMHRFYVFHPIRMFPHDVTAAAVFCLGSKSENYPHPLKYVVTSIMKAKHVYDLSYETVEKFMDEVLLVINFMAATLNNEFRVDHPQRYLEKACNNIKFKKDKENFENTFYCTISNSLDVTTFCILYPPQLVAAFSIYWTLDRVHYQIRETKDGEPWFKVIDKNITLDMLNYMKEEFDRNFENAPSMYNSELNKLKETVETLPKKRLYKDIEDEPPKEDHSTKRKIREKFENERISGDKLFCKEILDKEISLLKTASPSKASQNNSFKKIERKMNQKNLNQLKFAKPVLKSKKMSLLDFQQFRGIKSTVPLKVKPPKPLEKIDSSKEFIKAIIEEIPESYSIVKPIKKRIAHSTINSTETSSTYQKDVEPNIDIIALEEVVVDQDNTLPIDINDCGNVLPVESTAERTEQSFPSSDSSNFKSKKQKKNKLKRHKHKEKKKPKIINLNDDGKCQSTSDEKSDSSAIRIKISKTSDGKWTIPEKVFV